EDFKLPLDRIVASNDNELIVLALQVANLRGEVLPLEPLRKLVKSADQQVSKAATECLNRATGIGDSPRMEPSTGNDSVVAIKPDLTVKPFGENLFPKKVLHFVAIPKPGEAVAKFYETLQGLQLDSARSQANLALVLNGMRMMLAQQLSAPAGAPALLEYTGIDTNAPIALGSWTAGGAADSTTLAERRAIVLRVKDRARFERMVQQFQTTSGSLAYMTDYLAIGTRAIAAVPAFL